MKSNQKKKEKKEHEEIVWAARKFELRHVAILKKKTRQVSNIWERQRRELDGSRRQTKLEKGLDKKRGEHTRKKRRRETPWWKEGEDAGIKKKRKKKAPCQSFAGYYKQAMDVAAQTFFWRNYTTSFFFFFFSIYNYCSIQLNTN